MIAKELEGFETTAHINDEPKVLVFPVPDRHRYRYSEVTIRGKQFLAKKSCRSCHGTAIVGYMAADKAKGIPRTAIRCTCLIEQKEKDLDATQKEDK